MANGSYEVASGYVSLYARMESAQTREAIERSLSSIAPAVGKSFARDFSGSVGGAISKMGKATEGIGRFLTIGLGAGLIAAKKLTGGLFRTISTAENTSIAFRALSGHSISSAEAFNYSKDALNRLNKFAIKTPYEFDNISRSASKLVAMGYDLNDVITLTGNKKHPFKGIINDMGNWSAALGLTSQGFENVLTQMGHIKTTGHLYTRQMTALTNNGLAAWEALRQHMFGYVDDTTEAGRKLKETQIANLREMVTAGKISSDEAIAALHEYAQKFDGAMETMSLTFTGVMSNINDAIKVPLQSLQYTSGYKKMTSALNKMTEPLVELTKSILPILEEIFKRVGSLIEGAVPNIEKLAKNLSKADPAKLVDGLQAIAGLFASGPLIMGIGKMESFLGLLVTSGGKAASVLAAVGKSMGGFTFNKLGGLKDLFGKKTAGFAKSVGKSFSGLGGAFKGQTNLLGKALGDPVLVAKSIDGNVKTALVTSTKIAQASAERQLDIAKSAYQIAKNSGAPQDVMKSKLHDVRSASGKLSGAKTKQRTARKIQDGSLRAGKVFDGVQADVAKQTAGVRKTMEFGFRSAINSAKNTIIGSYDGIGVAFGQMFPKAKLKLDKGFDSLAKGISEKMTKLFMGDYDMTLGEVPGKLINSVKTVAGNVVTNIKGGVATAIRAVKAFPSKMVGAFKSIPSVCKNLGLQFKDLGLKALDMGGKIKKAVANLPNVKFSDIVKGAQDAGTKMAAFGKHVMSLRNQFSPLLGVAGSAMKGLKNLTEDFVMAAVRGFQVFSTSMLGAGAVFGAIALAATVAATAFLATGGSFANLGSIIQNTLAGLGDMVSGAMSNITTAINTALSTNQVGEFFSTITESISTFIGEIGAKAPEFMLAFGALFEQVTTGILDMVVTFGPTILEGGMQLFAGLLNGLSFVVEQITARMPEIISGIGTAIVNGAPIVGDAALNLFKTLISSFGTVIPMVISQIPTMIQQLGDWLIKNGPQLLVSAGKAFEKISKAMADAAPKVVTALINLLGRLISSFPTWGPRFLQSMLQVAINLATGLIRSIPNVLSGLRTVMGRLIAAIPAAGRGVLNAALSIGRNIINGIQRGISNGIGAVRDAAANVAKSALNAAMNFLGIKSPSREFMKIGRFIDLGLVKGIDGSTNAVTKSVRRLTDGLLDINPLEGKGATFEHALTMPATEGGGARLMTPDDIAEAMAREMDKVRLVMDGRTTAATLTPLIDKELGRLNYMAG